MNEEFAVIFIPFPCDFIAVNGLWLPSVFTILFSFGLINASIMLRFFTSFSQLCGRSQPTSDGLLLLYELLDCCDSWFLSQGPGLSQYIWSSPLRILA